MRAMPPVLFYIPWFDGAWWPITTYGVMRAAAIAAGIFAARRAFSRRGIDPDHVYWAAIWVTPAALLGATAFAVGRAVHAAASHGAPLLQTMLQEGATGGTLLLALPVTIAAFAAYVYLHRLPLAAGLDALAMSAVIALPVQRVGCYAAGCCYGKPTALPWSITYAATTGVYPLRAPLGVALHPTQVYDALAVAGLAVLVWALAGRDLPRGTVFCVFLAGYGAIRFVIEFLRDDPRTALWPDGPLITVIATAVMAIAGAAGLLWLRSRAAASPGRVE